MKRKYKIALVGNPNCGKTTLFNALTGTRQHTGNYPGVTVERKMGTLFVQEKECELIDLPGIYALSECSPEARVAFQELLCNQIDLIVNVIDGTILQRSLYLSTQLSELHIPMIIAMNMSDEIRQSGQCVDTQQLSHFLQTPIVSTVGKSGIGISELKDAIAYFLKNPESHGTPHFSYGDDLNESIAFIEEKIAAYDLSQYPNIPKRFFALKLLEHDATVSQLDVFMHLSQETQNEINHLWEKHAISTETFLADRRYALIAGACRKVISDTAEKRRRISDKIDTVLTNKWIGIPIFLGIMYLVFQLTFTCADPIMGALEGFFEFLTASIQSVWPEDSFPFLRKLFLEGIVSGVGGVLVFLPNIILLFFAISLLEDSGYMARVAFIMDGIMRKFGLHGKSFVPLILGFGCTVPAIMATRCIESEKDRITTIMVLPLMSCGARYPIYALLIPCFFTEYNGLVLWSIYLIGILVALVAAHVMKSTLFKGSEEVYLMELPPYRCPTFKSSVLHIWDRSRSYLKKAGTFILLASVILYFLNTYPQKEELSQDYDAKIAQLTAQMEKATDSAKIDFEAEVANYEHQKNEEMLAYSISGRIGKTMEYVFMPLGFDWKVSTALIGSLAAKEIFVSQLGILYSLGDVDESSTSLREHLARSFTPIQGYCIMLFCLLSIPCFASLAIARREFNSWKLMFIQCVMLFVVAYAVTWIVYESYTIIQMITS